MPPAGDEAWRPALDEVAEALRAEDWPMDKQGIAYAVGDMTIARSDGRCIPIRTVLDAVDADDFATPDDAIGALRAAVDAVRC